MPTGLAPQDLAHGVVEGAFALVFPDAQARDALGLRAISRAKHGGTAWYVWTKAHAGAFEIALMPGADERALLALRYFPDPEEDLFHGFADIERDCRCSNGLFDHTGTPRLDQADTLDPSLFHVGTLALDLCSDQGLVLTLYAQDCWIEEIAETRGWTTRRHVPGLELALAVVDPLLCALAYLGRRGPASVRAWREPGLRWRTNLDGAGEGVPDGTLADWRIEVRGLALPGRSAFVCIPSSASNDADGAPSYEIRAPDGTLPFPVSDRWWHAAQWRFEPVGMFCGHCDSERSNARAHDPHLREATHHDH